MAATRYKIWAVGDPVDRGATASYHVGVAGVAKGASGALPFVVSNELICGELGRAIGLPIPPGFLIERDGAPYYVSLNFNVAGEDLPPADIAALVREQPELATGVILFDVWVVNGDRHNRNLAYDKRTGSAQLFDHSHALMQGHAGRAFLEANRNQLGIGHHCVAREIVSFTGLHKWWKRIKGVPEFWIEDVLHAASTVGLPGADVQFCLDFLLERRERLPRLLADNAAAFPNRRRRK